MTFVEWLNYFASAPKENKTKTLNSNPIEEEELIAAYCIFPIM